MSEPITTPTTPLSSTVRASQSYTTPDPDWHYADEWHLLNQTKIAIEKRLGEMSSLIEKNAVFDRKLAETFQRFQREVGLLQTVRYSSAPSATPAVNPQKQS